MGKIGMAQTTIVDLTDIEFNISPEMIVIRVDAFGHPIKNYDAQKVTLSLMGSVTLNEDVTLMETGQESEVAFSSLEGSGFTRMSQGSYGAAQMTEIYNKNEQINFILRVGEHTIIRTLDIITIQNGENGIRGSQWFSTDYKSVSSPTTVPSTRIYLLGSSSSYYDSTLSKQKFLIDDKLLLTDSSTATTSHSGKLYACVIEGTGTSARFSYIGNIRGARGATGAAGNDGLPGVSAYNVIILTKDGRSFFSDDASGDIKLTANLLYGITQIEANVKYYWTASPSGSYDGTSFSYEGQELTVSRDKLLNITTFKCVVKEIVDEVELERATGYFTIEDFTDEYSVTINSTNGNIFSGQVINTDLSCELFKNGTLVQESTLRYYFLWTRTIDGIEEVVWDVTRIPRYDTGIIGEFIFTSKSKNSLNITSKDVAKETTFNVKVWDVDLEKIVAFGQYKIIDLNDNKNILTGAGGAAWDLNQWEYWSSSSGIARFAYENKNYFPEDKRPGLSLQSSNGKTLMKMVGTMHRKASGGTARDFDIYIDPNTTYTLSYRFYIEDPTETVKYKYGLYMNGGSTYQYGPFLLNRFVYDANDRYIYPLNGGNVDCSQVKLYVDGVLINYTGKTATTYYFTPNMWHTCSITFKGDTGNREGSDIHDLTGSKDTYGGTGGLNYYTKDGTSNNDTSNLVLKTDGTPYRNYEMISKIKVGFGMTSSGLFQGIIGSGTTDSPYQITSDTKTFPVYIDYVKLEEGNFATSFDYTAAEIEVMENTEIISQETFYEVARTGLTDTQELPSAIKKKIDEDEEVVIWNNSGYTEGYWTTKDATLLQKDYSENAYAWKKTITTYKNGNQSTSKPELDVALSKILNYDSDTRGMILNFFETEIFDGTQSDQMNMNGIQRLKEMSDWYVANVEADDGTIKLLPSFMEFNRIDGESSSNYSITIGGTDLVNQITQPFKMVLTGTDIGFYSGDIVEPVASLGKDGLKVPKIVLSRHIRFEETEYGEPDKKGVAIIWQD